MNARRFAGRLLAFICIITINLSGITPLMPLFANAKDTHDIESSLLDSLDESNDPLEYDHNGAIQGDAPDAIQYYNEDAGLDYAPASILTMTEDTVLYVKWLADGVLQNPDPNQPAAYPANPNDPAKENTTIACGDPVNVVTGSFTWEYTDLALG